MAEITEESLDFLRHEIGNMISYFRLGHTFGVEKMAVILGKLYCPEKIPTLRASALLHDITKEFSVKDHLKVYETYGLAPSKEELASPATLHSATAALLIPQKYPEIVTDEIVGAVRYHTTGRADMTIVEKIIYLADYIEETREYSDCVALRHEFFDAKPEEMNESDRMLHLNKVLLHSFDITIGDLLASGKTISTETVKARNSMIFEINDNK